MAKYRMVTTDFWKSPIVLEEMTPEDKIFYLFLLTNPETTQTGIYKITKLELAFYLGYSIETIHMLMERFTKQHKLILYNSETREIAIKNWGKFNLHRGGKPIMDCLISELKEVEDTSLIRYVLEMIDRPEIRSLYESFCSKEDIYTAEEMVNQDVNNTYVHTEYEELVDTSMEQQVLNPEVENHPDMLLRLDDLIELQAPYLDADNVEEIIKDYKSPRPKQRFKEPLNDSDSVIDLKESDNDIFEMLDE
jgi:hypothetical protein